MKKEFDYPKLLSWTISLRLQDTSFINANTDDVIVFVDPLSPAPASTISFGLQDYVELINAASKKDIEQLSKDIEVATNNLVLVGVRPHRPPRPTR